MTTQPDTYRARFSPTRQALMNAMIGALFCAVVVLVPTPLWLRVLTFGFFGLGSLAIVASSLIFRTALRVDQDGIMLRRYAFQPSSALFYPWEDVDQVLIWKYKRLKRLGIQRRDGAPPPPMREIGPVARSHLAVSAPGVPLDIAATAVTAGGWHLNEDRLARAVIRFAPRVRVVDIANGRMLHPGTERWRDG